MNKKFIIITTFIFLFFLISSPIFSANRYWVGGGSSTDWNAVGSTNWSATSGGANNASVPTSSDDVFFDANSTAFPCVLSATTTIRSLNCTGFGTGTLTHNAGVTLNIGDSQLGAGISSLKFVSTMNYILGSPTSSAIAFISPSNSWSVTLTIDFAGKTTGNVTFSGSGSFRLIGSHNTSSLSRVTVSAGTLSTNGQTLSWGTFNGTAGTISLGTSTLTLTGTGTVWNATGLTISANSSTIIVNDVSAVSKTFAGANKTTYNNITFTGDNITVSGSNTFLGTFYVQNAGLVNGLLLTSGTTQTVTSFTTNGSSGNLSILKSTVGASVATITKSSGIVNVDYMSIQDITAATAGTAIWYAGANSTNVSGNTGWSFTTPTLRYWVGGGSSNSWDAVGPTNWSTSSGGANNVAVPTSSDNVFFDGNSGVGNSVISANITIRSLDCSGYKGTLTHNAGVKLSIGNASSWNTNVGLKFVHYMTYTLGNAITSEIEFVSTAAATVHTIDFASKATGNVTFNGVGGSWRLVGNHNTGTTATVTLTNGTLDLNGYSVSWGLFNSNNGNTRTLTLGSSFITLTGEGNIWDFSNVTNLTFNANTSTIIVNNATVTAKTFIGGGKTFNHVTFSGDNITVTGSNTFNEFRVQNAGLPNGLLLTAGTTQTVTGFSTNGSAGNLAILKSATGASAATITKASGRVSVDYMSLQDITAATSGTATWFAGTNSTNVSGNTVWSFTKPSARYWVGGNASTNWDAAGNTNWSTTSGGANNASVPGANDDVIFDANSGSGISTINAAYSIRSLNTTGFTGTLVHNAFTLSIGGGNGFPGIENVALKFGSGMTYSLSSATTSAITFTATTSTSQSVDFAGKITGNVAYNGVGGSWKLTGTHTTGDATVTLTNGTLNTNNQTCTWGVFDSNNGNARTLNLGSSTINLIGISAATYWTTSTITNLTVIPNSATVNIIKKINISAPTFVSGAKDFNGMSLAFQGGGSSSINFSAAGGVLKNLSVTGALEPLNPTLEDILIIVTSGADFSVTNNLNLNGYSSSKRLLVKSNGFGIRTIKVTGASVNCSNVDFGVIELSSTNSSELPINLSSILGGSGDVGGNIGITFSTGVPLYWYTPTTGTKYWSDESNWYLASNGAGGNAGRIPLPQDDVVFDASSIGAANTTITSNVQRMGKTINWTGVTNAPTWYFPITGEIYGSLILGAGMTISVPAGTGSQLHMVTTGANQTYEIRTNGVVMRHSFFRLMSGVSTSYVNSNNPITTNTIIFGDDYNGTDTHGIYVSGRVDLNNKNITLGMFKVGQGFNAALNMGSSYLNITGAEGTNGNFDKVCGLQTGIICGTSTVELSNGTALPKQNNQSINVTLNNFVISGAGEATYYFWHGITYNNFIDNKTCAHTLLFAQNATSTFNGNITFNNSAGNYITIGSINTTDPGIAPTGTFGWSKASGTVNADYLILSKSRVAGGATFNATNLFPGSSIDGGGNFGWNGLAVSNFNWTGADFATNINWSNPLNWQGGVVPGTTDIAYFTSAGTRSCNIDVDPNCLGINVVLGYPGTITQQSAITIGTKGFEMNGGTFTGATQNITNAGSFRHMSGAFRHTSGVHEVTAQGSSLDTWREGGGTTTLTNGTVKISGTLNAILSTSFGGYSSGPFQRPFAHLELNTTGVVSGTFGVNGNLTRTQGTTLDAIISLKGDYLGAGVLDVGAGSGVITFNATLAQSFTYPAAPSVVINKASSSVLNIPGDIKIGSNWTTSSTNTGTFTWNNKKVTFTNANAGDITVSRGSFYEVEINKNSTETVNISNLCTVSNDLKITSLANLNLASGNTTGFIEVSGNYITNDNSWGGTSKIIFKGSSSNSFSGSGKQGVSAEIYKPGGSLQLATNFDMPNTGHDLLLRSGALDLSGYNLTVNDSLTIYGTMSLKGSEIITVNGLTTPALTNPNFTISATSSTIVYTDSAVTATVTNLSKNFYNLTLGASKTHEFATGAPNLTTINGRFASNGTSGTRSILRSVANASVDWKLTLLGTSTLADKVAVKRSDASGGLGVLAVGSINYGNNTNWVGLVTPPTITSITSSTADGSYTTGQNISVRVNFSESITLTGTITVNLDSGGATLISGFTGTTATGTYTVLTNHSSNDLSATSVVVTGTALNAGLASLDTTLPATNINTGSDIVVDGVAPTITSITSSTANGFYKAGDNIAVRINFSETITLVGTMGINLNSGGVVVINAFTATTATGTYTVLAGHNSSDLTATSVVVTGTARDAVLQNLTLTLPGTNIATGSDIVIDTVAPTITSITSSTANGSYKAGAAIAIRINFSESITLIGTMTINLDSGGVALISAFTGTTATATYTVLATQNSSDLTASSVSVSTSARDSALNNLSTTLPGTNIATGSNIVIDTTAPTITSITSSTANGYYTTGAVIAVRINFSESITLTGTMGINLDTGGVVVINAFSGTTVTGNYTVLAGHASSDLTASSVTINNTARDAALNNLVTTLPGTNIATGSDIVIDSTPPAITSITSSTANGSYKAGAVISVRINFSEAITLVGTMGINLDTGGVVVINAFASGTTATGTYTVLAGHTSADLTASSVTVNTTARDSALNNLVTTLPGTNIATNSNIVIDTSAPTITSITSSTADGAYKAGGNISVRINFSEVITLNSTMSINLDSGGACLISAMSGTTATGTYTVQAGQNSSDLTASSVTLINPGPIVAKINFQPDASATPAGYLKDNGAVYSSVRGYGWDASIESDTRDRGALNSDQRLTTFAYSTPARVWTYDISNGDYLITVFSGDAQWAQGPHRVVVQGNTAINDVSTNINEFASAIDFPATVTNGQLTITIGGTAWNTMINYVIIREAKKAQDAAKNNLVLTLPGTNIATASNIVVDTTAPTITSITSSTADGSYKAGSNINVRINFSEPITVVGTLNVNLDTGGVVAISAFTGTTATGVYTVQSGHTSSDLNASSVTLTSTARDVALNNLNTTLPGTNIANGSNIVIDTTVPTITSITSSTANGSYGAGSVIAVRINFSEAITLVGTMGINLDTGGVVVINAFSGTTATGNYTVLAGHTSSDLTASSVTVNTTARDAALNNLSVTLPGTNIATGSNIIIDTSVPSITSITSSTANGYYKAGAAIAVRINFSEAITLVGTMGINLDTGGVVVITAFSNGTTATGTYTVLAGHTSSDLTASTVTVNTTARDAALNNLSTTLPGTNIATNSDLVIDTTAPTITSITSSTANGTYGAGSNISVRINFSEAITIVGTLGINLDTGGIVVINAFTGTTSTGTYTVSAGHNSTDLTASSVTVNNTVRDAALNNLVTTLPGTNIATGSNIVVDTTAPTITSITSSTANGNYSVGASISVRINFSEAITLVGTMGIHLDSGGYAEIAAFANGTTATGTYTVLAGHTSTDLTASSVTVNTTARDAALNNLVTTLPGTNIATGSNIVIDTTAPTIASITSSTANGSYKAGAVIAVRINFSETITLVGTMGVNLDTGGVVVISGFTGTTATGNYTVLAGHTSSDLTASSVVVTGTARDATLNNLVTTLPGTNIASGSNIIIDTTAPTITSITSSTANSSYKASAVIAVRINFSETITVTGTLGINLDTGGVVVINGFTGTTATGNYTVLAGHTSSDLTASSVTVNTSAQDAALNNLNVTLPGTNIATGSNIVIDTTAPTITSITSSTANGSYKAGALIAVRINFSEVITLVGTMGINLDTGGVVVINAFTGTTATGNYTVLAGHTSSDLTASSVTVNSTARDSALNNLSTTLPGTNIATGSDIIIDTTAPTITSITSSTANGSYTTGASIAVRINFSETITVVGTLGINLDTGGVVVINAFTGTTATGNYTVLAGHNSADLTANSVTVNNTARDAALNNLVTTLPGTNIASNSNIVIDTTAPTITSITSSSANGSYGTSSPVIAIRINFSEVITLVGTMGINLDSGGVVVINGFTGTTATGNYTVLAGHTSNDLTASSVVVTGTARDGVLIDLVTTLPGTNIATGSNIIVDTTAPTITSITSSTANGSYTTGATIAVRINFSEPITLVGTMGISLDTGGVVVIGAFSGTTATGNYTVLAAHNSTDLTASSVTVNTTARDAALNNLVTTLPGTNIATNSNIVIDTSAPTITSITSSTANGSYKAGTLIAVRINFSEVITLVGTMGINLDTGGIVVINAFTGTTVTGNYTVLAGHTSSDLTASSVTVNTTARDSALNDLVTTLPGTNIATNSNIIIDTTAPTITSITSSTADGSYTTGASISVRINFSELITLVGTMGITLDTGGVVVINAFANGTTATGTYSVLAGHTSADLTAASVTVNTTARDAALNNLNITLPGINIATGSNIVIDTTAPTITSITSSTANGYYSTGAVIAVRINFSDVVTLSGTMGINLDTGGVVVINAFTGTTATGNYTVLAGHNSADLTTSSVSITGTARDSSNLDLVTTLPGTNIATNSNIVVDTTAPTISSITSSTANGTYGIGAVISVRINFSEVITLVGTMGIALDTGGVVVINAFASGTTATGTYTVLAGHTSSDLTASSVTVNTTARDAALNNLVTTLPGTNIATNSNIVIDTSAPSITSITSSTANGSYKAGSVISVRINFSDNITLTGTMGINLDTGGVVVINGFTGTTATGNYTVLAGHTSSDLTASSVVVTGTARDAGLNDLILTLPGTNIATNSNIIIDTAAPTITSITSSTANGNYTTGATVAVRINFSEPITLVGTMGINLDAGGVVVIGVFSGTTTTGNYTVLAGHNSSDLTASAVVVNTTARDAALNDLNTTLPGTNIATNSNIVVDTSAPTITSITSSNANGSYGAGSTINVRVNFSEPITLVGTMGVNLDSGGVVVINAFVSGTTATGTYTVLAGHNSTDLTASSVTVNTTARDASLNNLSVTLPGTNIATNSNIIVDTTAPTISSITSSTANGSYGTGAVIAVRINFSEPITLVGTIGINLDTGGLVVINPFSGTTATGNYTVLAGHTSLDLTASSVLVNTTARDAALNNLVTTLPGTNIATNSNIVIDTTAPVINSITSSTANGAYGLGANISIRVNFSDVITLTGTMGVNLDTGGVVVINAFSGTTITGTYTVLAGHTSADLTASSVVVTGTAKDGSLNNLLTTLPGTNIATNSNIIIDTTTPTITSITSSTANGSYKAGANIAVRINFSEAITLTGTMGINLDTGGVVVINGFTGTTATGTYTVLAGHTSSDLTASSVVVTGTAQDQVLLNLNTTLPGTNIATGSNIMIDTAVPTITSITSSTANGSYKAGATIAIRINFSEAITVTGTMGVILDTGGLVVINGFTGTTVTGNYTVLAGHTSSDLTVSSVNINSTARDIALNDLSTTLPGTNIASGSDIIIDTSAPTITSITSSTGNGSYTTGANIALRINFSEAITVTGTLGINLNSGGVVVINGFSGTTATGTYTVLAGHNSLDLTASSVTVNTTARDAALNDLATTLPGTNIATNSDIIIDTTAPTITSIISTTANGSYKAGVAIAVRINFSEAITLTGTMGINLDTGGAVVINGFTGTTALGSYTVLAGHNSTDLTANSVVVTGTAQDAVLINLVTTLPSTNIATGSNIVVDTTAPTITSITSSTANGTYGAGANISVRINFSEPITLVGTMGINLDSGGVVVISAFSGTTTTGTYTVLSGHSSADLTASLVVVNTTARDAALNNLTTTLPGTNIATASNIVIDTTAPTITSITSSTANGSYKAGAVISVRVNFSDAITLVGTMGVNLDSGGVVVINAFSGTTVTGSYTVLASHNSSDLTASSVVVTGTARDIVSLDLVTTLPGTNIATNSDIIVDTTAPSITSITSSTANGTYGIGSAISVRINFSEAITLVGTIGINLNSGGVVVINAFAAGTTATGTYTVLAGHSSSDLSASSVTVNNTARDAALNNLNTTLPVTNIATGSDIVIDTSSPTITSITSSTANGSYGLGSVISVRINFSDPITLVGTMAINLDTGGIVVINPFVSGTTATGTYTVLAGHNSSDLTATSVVVNTTARDSALNDLNTTLPSTNIATGSNIVIDTTTPTIISIVSSTANGSYKAGAAISVRINFSEVITLVGTMGINLDTGGVVVINAFSGTTATGTYTVLAGHTSADLTASSVAVTGTARDAVLLNLNTSLPGTNIATGSNIVIDTTAPTITSITSSSANGSYKAGAAISVRINFSEPITVTGTLGINLDSSGVVVINAFSGTTATGTYTVLAGHTSADLTATSISVNTSAVDGALNNLVTTLPVTNISTASDIVIDTAAPTITSITSSTADGLYGIGDTISVRVNFSEVITLIGTMVINLDSGGSASISAFSGTTATGTYTVLASHTSSDLTASSVFISATCRDVALNDLNTTLPSTNIANGSALVVDGVAPVIQSSVLGALNAYLDVTIGESVYATNTATGVLDASDFNLVFAANGGSATNVSIASVTKTSGSALVGGESAYRLNLTITGTVSGTETITVNPFANSIFDLAGNPASNSTTTGAVTLLSSVGPSITNVTSSNADGSYKQGNVIAIEVVFSAIVNVTGTPVLTLETGTTDQPLSYVSGSGSTTLVFNYTIQSGDSSIDLDYLSTSALALSGGTIKNVGGNNAVLVLPSPGATGSLGFNKNIVIDTSIPVITNVSSVKADGTYKAGELITISVTFSEPVTITGGPSITLETGIVDRSAIYSSGSGTSTIIFSYTVQSGDTSIDLDYGSVSSLSLSGGAITDLALNAAVLTMPTPGASGSLGFNKSIILDTTIPTVTSVNSTMADGYYKIGSLITISVTFSEPINISGSPIIALETGATDRNASYASGSGTTTLLFNYTVQSGDSSLDLDYIATTSLSLNGGSINDVALNAANLTLASPAASNSLGSNKSLIVDGVIPTITAHSLDSDNSFIDITFSESVFTNNNGTGGLSANDFSVTFNSNGGSGKALTITSVLSNTGVALSGGESTVRISYSITGKISGKETFSINAVSNSIFDIAGNAVLSTASTGTLSFTDQVIPKILDVTSSTANGIYKEGAVISIQITFSEAVVVTGKPNLTLETGTADQKADYSSGSGTTILTFEWTVQKGGNTLDLDYQSTSAISGGTILDESGNSANLTMPEMGSLNSLGFNKDLIIDTTAPTILSVTINKTNEYVDVVFSEAVYTRIGAGGINPGDFDIDFFANGGTATGVSITSILSTSDTALAGGETAIRVYISVSGNVSGKETIMLKVIAQSIFDFVGNALEAKEVAGNLKQLINNEPPTSSGGGGGGGCQYAANGNYENAGEWILLLLVMFLLSLIRFRK